jgi:penicillin amidase
LIEALVGINKAAGYDEFRAALSKWDVAGQNVVYADVEGNIAYQATGELPIRASGDGSWPVPGWTGEHEWVGVVPFEEMPSILNPPDDYISTANQPVVRPGAQPFFSVDANYGYRAARIAEMLAGMPAGFSVASAQDLQMDGADGGAPDLMPHLLAISSEDEAVAAMRSVMEPWSTGPGAYIANPDSAGCAAYQATWSHVLRLVFQDELPEDSWPDGGSRWFAVVAALVQSPDDPFWDDVRTEIVEDRDTILEQAMIAAHHELSGLLGNEPSSWRWGDLHIASFENLTFGQSGIAPIEWLFNRTAPTRVGGSDDIVNAVGFHPPDGYGVDWLPSMRMVIDLSDLSGSTSVNSTGQSGHAFHGHYDDMLPSWADGTHHPLRWDREQVEQGSEGTLTLVPAG